MEQTIIYLAAHPLMPVLLMGWVFDLLLGDPVWLPHPVVYMGKWIARWEHRLNRGRFRMAKGAVLAVLSIVLVYLAVWVLWSQIGESLWWFRGLLAAVLVFYCLAGHTLRREVRMVFEALDQSLDQGRRQVARIVGRDTQNLSGQEVRTAALETLAENLSDGVVAPLFWLALLGVPGMVAYKMVNTLDSMVGYHSPRYREFGCWAARIDDVANYLPARLTALLMLVANALLYLDFVSMPRLLAFVLRFGPRHASPNSGWPEAALAGILDCRFGGTHDYFGQSFYKPYIGAHARPLTTKDMWHGLRVCQLAEMLAVGLVALCLTL